jgi:hypothetical protein
MMNTIEPDAVYTEHHAWAWFNIGHATQKTERDAGRLQYALIDGKPAYRGAWILAWLEANKTTGPLHTAAYAAKRAAVPSVPTHAASAVIASDPPTPTTESIAMAKTQHEKDLEQAHNEATIDRWNTKLNALMAGGMDRAAATRELVRSDHDLHADYLAAVNAENRRKLSAQQPGRYR